MRLNLFPTKKPYGFPVRYFRELIKLNFEGMEFPCTRYYDEYLKIKYGDYMEQPPMSERKVHPVSAVKFG